MSLEDSNKDWLIELNVRPNAISPVDPPSTEKDENDSRILLSIFAMTFAESFFSHNIDPYIHEHIQLEKECSQQDDLNLVWSDDISLTLCFLASLAHHGEYSEGHLLERYFQWWMNGYMCPTGLCFTPRVHLKKSIDLFGETQAAEALGYEVDLDSKTYDLTPKPGAFLRMSPIAYFYGKHSSSKRIKVINDCYKRMFGSKVSNEVFIAYIELLVKALNGFSKEEILKTIQLKHNSNDCLNQIFFDLIYLLSNDNNNIEEGIIIALEKRSVEKKEFKYLNPYDSDETILLTLYLQLSAAIYNFIPQDWFNKIYAKHTLESLTKWIIYQRNQNLRSI